MNAGNSRFHWDSRNERNLQPQTVSFPFAPFLAPFAPVIRVTKGAQTHENSRVGGSGAA